MTLRLTGAKELEDSLKRAGPRFVTRVGNRSLKAGAKEIVTDAKQRVPVRTGELRDSITALVSRRHGPDERKVVVGTKHPTARRAHFTEFGTVFQPAQPFLRPAVDTQAQAALDEITRVLREGIEREEYKSGGIMGDTLSEIIEGVTD